MFLKVSSLVLFLTKQDKKCQEGELSCHKGTNYEMDATSVTLL